MKKKILGMLVCILITIACVPAVNALDAQNALPTPSPIIGVKLIATVTKVRDTYNLLGGAIHVNDTITGKYVYNSEFFDSDPDPAIGEYVHLATPYGIEINAGGFVFKTDPKNVYFIISILNDYAPYGYPPIDEFLVGSIYHLPLSNGLLVTSCSWSLEDTTATALSSTDLPTKAPVLADWNGGQGIYIAGENPSNPDQTYTIQAHVTKAIKNNAITMYGAESEKLSMTIPHNSRIPFMQFWIQIFEQFPHAFPIFRHLMGF